MKKQTVSIQLEKGLEARSVAMLVQIASQFESKVYIEADEKKVNAKSIMGVMTLALNKGDELDLVIDGSDENQAFDKLNNYLLAKVN